MSEAEKMRRSLEMLCKSEYMSGEDMSRELGMTRAAVWKKIEALRLEGWNIEDDRRISTRILWIRQTAR